MFSQPRQCTRITQTEPQAHAPPVCVPLLMVDTDGRKRYCYHGGKCRCEMCEIIRQSQRDELDRNPDPFIPDAYMKLVPGIRHTKQKQYAPQALRVSPEMGLILLKDHLSLIKRVPIYYLPDKYYATYSWKVLQYAEASTQTEMLTVGYGLDGCPCADKAVCWDI